MIFHRHKYSETNRENLYLVRDYNAYGWTSHLSDKVEEGKECALVTLITQECECGKINQFKINGHCEQKIKELESIIQQLLREAEKLSEQSVPSPVDIIAKARAEQADLEARRIK